MRSLTRADRKARADMAHGLLERNPGMDVVAAIHAANARLFGESAPPAPGGVTLTMEQLGALVAGGQAATPAAGPQPARRDDVLIAETIAAARTAGALSADECGALLLEAGGAGLRSPFYADAAPPVPSPDVQPARPLHEMSIEELHAHGALVTAADAAARSMCSPFNRAGREVAGA
jgi:hypothetical protein